MGQDPLPPAQLLAFSDQPFDAIAELAAGWSVQYDQLERGRNRSSLAQLCLGGVDIGDTSVLQTTAVRGAAPHGSIAFGLAHPRHGYLFRGRAVRPDDLIVHASDEELDIQYRGAMFSFVVERARLEDRLGREHLAVLLDDDRVRLPTARAGALRNFASTVLHQYQAHPELLSSRAASRAVSDQLLDHLVRGLRSTPPLIKRDKKPGPLPRRAAAAKRAEAFMRERLGAPTTMQDLLDVTGVRESTLRTGFVERFGHGPKRHGTLLRLNAVRRALQAGGPETTVTTVATSLGFWHFGRLSSAYRETFGELPSQTLRRAISPTVAFPDSARDEIPG